MRAMRVTVVVVGAGQAGLAMSRHLAVAGLDHVVLERGEVASSWRTERWDSLRLLTPNWMCRLPGYRYEGPDPDGYQTAAETAGWLEAYACRTGAPVRTHGRGATGATDGRRLRGRDRRRLLPRRGRRRRGGCVERPAGPGGRGRAAPPHQPADRPALPEPCTTRRHRRRARGRCVGLGRPDRGRAPTRGTSRHPRGRRARPAAAHLPRPRHLLLAGGDRPARRALRRGRRHRAGAPPRLGATRRQPDPDAARPQRALRRRRRPRRPAHAGLRRGSRSAPARSRA